MELHSKSSQTVDTTVNEMELPEDKFATNYYLMYILCNEIYIYINEDIDALDFMLTLRESLGGMDLVLLGKVDSSYISNTKSQQPTYGSPLVPSQIPNRETIVVENMDDYANIERTIIIALVGMVKDIQNQRYVESIQNKHVQQHQQFNQHSYGFGRFSPTKPY